MRFNSKSDEIDKKIKQIGLKSIQLMTYSISIGVSAPKTSMQIVTPLRTLEWNTGRYVVTQKGASSQIRSVLPHQTSQGLVTQHFPAYGGSANKTTRWMMKYSGLLGIYRLLWFIQYNRGRNI